MYSILSDDYLTTWMIPLCPMPLLHHLCTLGLPRVVLGPVAVRCETIPGVHTRVTSYYKTIGLHCNIRHRNIQSDVPCVYQKKEVTTKCTNLCRRNLRKTKFGENTPSPEYMRKNEQLNEYRLSTYCHWEGDVRGEQGHHFLEPMTQKRASRKRGRDEVRLVEHVLIPAYKRTESLFA